jgi:DNA modification methylase
MLANPDAVQKARELAAENSDLVTKSLVKAVIRQDCKADQLSAAKTSIIEQTRQDASGTPPVVRLMDCVEFIAHCKPYDLLLTDPPYSTDIEDIEGFVGKWLYSALERVKPTGSAYIFIGAYPKELQAYLNAEIPANVHLEQILIWTYKNTGGKIPNEHYKQNYQACLYYRGSEAGTLDNKDNEFWAVTEMNAPDGRVGDRFHAWQKPMSLAEMYVRHSTKKGDLVVDPFCCTGTFLLAAAKLGRVALGADNNEENLKIALDRGCRRA